MVILVLTFIDVFMRYVFASPVTGATEIIRFCMALAVFAGLPLLTRDRGHITVSLIDGLLGKGALRIKQALCDLVSLLAIALLAWRLWDQAHLYTHNQTATIVLDLPMAPLVYALFGFTVLTALLLAFVMINTIKAGSISGEPS
jgi:TRAP-type C4-dicarboxylate transport system permease small subunit